ncbi:MAG: DUF2271 domain-containing protein [Gammaproteobacteria bacterium]|jgi:thiamine biosynthesis lipoprotein|nr:DUF2271 domain-containing protein [Gammaproteobacteria bacterium]
MNPDQSFLPVLTDAKAFFLACKGLSSILILTASVLSTAAESLPPLSRHYDNVLGTSFDLVIHGGDASRQEQAVETALLEIEKLEQIFSTWREDSEIMTLNRQRQTTEASDDLLEVLDACESWLLTSNNAFSCRMGQVIDLWNTAEAQQVRPMVPDTLPIARAAQKNLLIIDPLQRRVELGESINLEPTGLAKGYIIDRVMTLLRQELPEATAIKVDIGGDASYWGQPDGTDNWLVNIADPNVMADNSNFISTLSLNGMAVATSGHNTRTWKFEDLEFSQILDTRRGWPVANGLYVVVIAPDAMTADAMSTTLASQYLGPALKFINSTDNVEALIVEQNGTTHFSDNWQDYYGGDLLRQANSNIELTLTYTIPNLRSRNYERPYVSIWVSDTTGRPIKNLLLLGTETQWARTNALWWRRVGRRGVVPASNVTRPTRMPGKYQLSWNGNDDNGNNILEGDYQLMLEASREHGDHNTISIPFSLKAGTQNIDHAGEGELGAVNVFISLTTSE